MSHLLESYSLQTGAKISKPFIVTNFFPTPEKYITIHNSSGMGGKSYDYYQDVVDEIIQTLNSQNIKIIQIGTKDDMPLDGCIHLQGKTNFFQTSFIIGNSLLHIGNDSFPVHLASAANIPIVALYSITTPEIAGPFFSDEDKVACLTPKYGNNKPSFNPNEIPKTVNTIKIEEVVSSVFEKLGLKNERPQFSSLFIGNRYQHKIVEFIPDTILRPDFVPEIVVNMRIDIADDSFNENIALANIKNRKFAICMSPERRINNIQALQAFKKNIVEIFIDISNADLDMEYVKAICAAGFRPIIVFKSIEGQGIERFNENKIKAVDTNLKFIHIKFSKDELDKIQKIVEEEKNVFLKTNRIVLSNGKVYLSNAHRLLDIPTKSRAQKIEKNLEKLGLEAEYLYIYKQKE